MTEQKGYRGPSFANMRRIMGKIQVRVMCPECGASGGHNLFTYQPKCHKCNYKVIMLPASNNYPECTWAEAEDYYQKIHPDHVAELNRG